MGKKEKLLIFYPKKGVGDLLFTHTEKDIISFLGEPKEIIKDEFDENEYSIDLYYGNEYSFFSSTNYENDNFDRTDFFLQDLILDKVQFSSLSKVALLDYINSYHLKYDYKYKVNIEYRKSVEDEIYTFDSIGLMIWFEGEDLSDISNICVSRVLED